MAEVNPDSKPIKANPMYPPSIKELPYDKARLWSTITDPYDALRELRDGIPYFDTGVYYRCYSTALETMVERVLDSRPAPVTGTIARLWKQVLRVFRTASQRHN